MAIKNILNDDEGTQKSKREARREARQMRSLNEQAPKFSYTAEGEKVKNEPLYSKEEIKAVRKNKPVKSQPSKLMEGTIGGVTYNDPNKPAEPTEFEYKLFEPGGYSSSVKPMTYDEFGRMKKEDLKNYQKTGQFKNKFLEDKTYEDYLKAMNEKYNIPSSETGPISVTKEQFQGLTSDNVDVANQVGSALKNAIVSSDKTFQEKANDMEGVNPVETEIKDKIDIIDKTTEGITPKSKINEIVESVPQEQITWDLSEPGAYVPTSEEEIRQQASLAKKRTPQLVIEKLGIQDYYPEIGRNIAVGTFSGSRIGSQTIYSGAGGLLPLGLYDARKRAIAGEIKKKEAIMDQIKEIPNIAKQFQTEYSSLYMDFLSPWINAYKDKPEELLNNTDFLRDQAHWKSVAENFLKVDTDLRKFKEKLEPEKGMPAAWATPAMLEIQRKFLSGFLPGKTEAWLKGEKNISKLAETVQALPNGYSVMDEKVKELFKDPLKIKTAIKPKDGIRWTPELTQKVNDLSNKLSQQIQSGSPDYERYLSMMEEFFDFNFDSMVNEWVDGNTLSALTDKEKAAYKDSLSKYIKSHLPTQSSFVATIKDISNNSATRYSADKRLQGQLARINWERERWEKEFTQNPTNALLDAAIADKANGGAGTFEVNLPSSKANQVYTKDLFVDVYDVNGVLQPKVPMSTVKNAPAGTYFREPGQKGSINPSDIPDQIYYQATKAAVYDNRANGYNYANSGVGFKMEKQAIEGGGYSTIETPLNLNFSTRSSEIMSNGIRNKAQIGVGNLYYGQPAAQQSEKYKQSAYSGSGNINEEDTND